MGDRFLLHIGEDPLAASQLRALLTVTPISWTLQVEPVTRAQAMVLRRQLGFRPDLECRLELLADVPTDETLTRLGMALATVLARTAADLVLRESGGPLVLRRFDGAVLAGPGPRWSRFREGLAAPPVGAGPPVVGIG